MVLEPLTGCTSGDLGSDHVWERLGRPPRRTPAKVSYRDLRALSEEVPRLLILVSRVRVAAGPPTFPRTFGRAGASGARPSHALPPKGPRKPPICPLASASDAEVAAALSPPAEVVRAEPTPIPRSSAPSMPESAVSGISRAGRAAAVPRRIRGHPTAVNSGTCFLGNA